MKIQTPNSCCTDNTCFLNIFYGFLGFVVWEISGHSGGVYQNRYFASDGVFLFSFVCVMYLNIASHLYGKQIKSKMGNKLNLQMIFICVRLNWLDIHEWHTMPLNSVSLTVLIAEWLEGHAGKQGVAGSIPGEGINYHFGFFAYGRLFKSRRRPYKGNQAWHSARGMGAQW